MSFMALKDHIHFIPWTRLEIPLIRGSSFCFKSKISYYWAYLSSEEREQYLLLAVWPNGLLYSAYRQVLYNAFFIPRPGISFG